MDQEIEEQIARGQRLLEEVSGLAGQLQPRGAGTVQAQYEALSEQFYSWEEYNLALLGRRFSTGKIADEYRLVVFGFGASRTEYDVLMDLLRDINGQLRKLGSIREPTRVTSGGTRVRSGIFGHTGWFSGAGRISAIRSSSFMAMMATQSYRWRNLVERITGERPAILHEQADSGRTARSSKDMRRIRQALLPADTKERKGREVSVDSSDALNLRARQK